MQPQDSQAKIKSNYISLFKTDGGNHLYRKIQAFEQSAIDRAIVATTDSEKLRCLAEVEAYRKLRAYIDLATDNMFKKRDV